MAILNLGILAHVDAGKTSLTERILFETGVIRTVGRVDHGDTQTDSLELERARGITIKAAVVSFQLGDLTVNLIDTPGHADFIAEVERSLQVLDAVVLVVSAVEGVQSQTRRLARAIRASGLPLMIFVNKIDRVGARQVELLEDIRTNLGLRLAVMNTITAIGSAEAHVQPLEFNGELASVLAESSEHVLKSFVETDGHPPHDLLAAELRAQVANCSISPVHFGSALLGIGVGPLLNGIERLAPPAIESNSGRLSGRVFKIQRSPVGEKIVYARIFNGSVSVRQRITMLRQSTGSAVTFEERITGIERFTNGSCQPVVTAESGSIVCLHGLKGAQIGDAIGVEPEADRNRSGHFPMPSLESVIHSADPASATRLHIALQNLAEQDPLINLRVHERSGDLSLRLYGEVQKEVIAETLRIDFDLETYFGVSLPICIERPIGIGSALEIIGTPQNPFLATVGFQIEPGPVDSGIEYRHEPGSLKPSYYRVTEETALTTLKEGLFGWNVTDCIVTLSQVGYSPPTTGTDFRKLVPLVLMTALDRAQTVVCEPVERFELTVPADALTAALNLLGSVRGVLSQTIPRGSLFKVIGTIPTEHVHFFEQRLRGLGRGEVSFSSAFESYEPVTAEIPVRPRQELDPRNRKEYLATVSQR